MPILKALRGAAYRFAAIVLLAASPLAMSVLAPISATAQSPWGKDYFPNVSLTTETGKKVKFYDDVLKGKVLVVNFMFTKCGDVCPLDTAQLKKVSEILGDKMGKSVFFYSISVDPKNDTPAALTEFKKVITDFPGSDQSKEAQDKVKACEERLAGHGFEIAYGYYRRKAFRAAISRLSEIMNLYPNYSALDRVYYTLGDCYFLMNILDQAVPYFSKVVTDYPGQKTAESASKRLAEIEKLKKNPPSPKPKPKKK